MAAYPKRTYDPFADDDSEAYMPPPPRTPGRPAAQPTPATHRAPAPTRSWSAKPGRQHVRIRDLDPAVVATLKRLAAAQDRSLNWLLVHILTDYAHNHHP